MSSFLTLCPLFKTFEERELEIFLRVCKERSYTKGERVLNKNSENSFMFVILEGKVSVRESSPEGLDFDIITLGPPDFFGEMSYIDRNPVSADLVALSFCRMLRISFADLDSLFQSHPQLAAKFLKNLTLEIVTRLRRGNLELKKFFAF